MKVNGACKDEILNEENPGITCKPLSPPPKRKTARKSVVGPSKKAKESIENKDSQNEKNNNENIDEDKQRSEEKKSEDNVNEKRSKSKHNDNSDQLHNTATFHRFSIFIMHFHPFSILLMHFHPFPIFLMHFHRFYTIFVYELIRTPVT